MNGAHASVGRLTTSQREQSWQLRSVFYRGSQFCDSREHGCMGDFLIGVAKLKTGVLFAGQGDYRALAQPGFLHACSQIGSTYLKSTRLNSSHVAHSVAICCLT